MRMPDWSLELLDATKHAKCRSGRMALCVVHYPCIIAWSDTILLTLSQSYRRLKKVADVESNQHAKVALGDGFVLGHSVI